MSLWLARCSGVSGTSSANLVGFFKAPGGSHEVLQFRVFSQVESFTFASVAHGSGNSAAPSSRSSNSAVGRTVDVCRLTCRLLLPQWQHARLFEWRRPEPYLRNH